MNPRKVEWMIIAVEGVLVFFILAIFAVAVHQSPFII